MNKGIWCVVLCLLAVAICMCASESASAQAPACPTYASCSYYDLWNPVCLPPLPPGAYNCFNSGPWQTTCSVPSSACPPPGDPPPPPPCPRCQAGAPIDLLTGDTFIEETDLKLPGLGGGLTVVRTWNSIWPATQAASQVGLFGPNWRSTFEERVFVGDDHYVKYARGDGYFWSFGWNGTTNTVAAPANVVATLDQGSTYWTLTFQNGEKRLFNVSNGSLVSVIDRNGNTTSLSYDATNRLTTVADPASRHLYFNYPSDTSRLVSSITSDFGISLTYAYDTQNRLIHVTKPDQTTWNFQYDNNSMITSVTDSDGKILESHTYDAGHRGLTSSRAGGVEAVTVSFQ